MFLVRNLFGNIKYYGSYFLTIIFAWGNFLTSSYPMVISVYTFSLAVTTCILMRIIYSWCDVIKVQDHLWKCINAVFFTNSIISISPFGLGVTTCIIHRTRRVWLKRILYQTLVLRFVVIILLVHPHKYQGKTIWRNGKIHTWKQFCEKVKYIFCDMALLN